MYGYGCMLCQYSLSGSLDLMSWYLQTRGLDNQHQIAQKLIFVKEGYNGAAGTSIDITKDPAFCQPRRTKVVIGRQGKGSMDITYWHWEGLQGDWKNAGYKDLDH